MKKILTMSVREMYAALLIILMLLFSLIYTSMALFEKTVEKVGIASIVASEINFTLTSDESAFIVNGNSGTITVLAGETKTFDIVVTNNIGNSARYKMYYRFENDITILDVNVGISSNSDSQTSDLIDISESKIVKVIIENNSTQSATIEIGAQGGYATNQVIVLNTGRNEMDTIQENSIPTFTDTSGANEPVLADGMIPVVYDDENDVWLVADTDVGYYAYQDQIWANAVTVTSTNRTTYLNAEPGTPIPMDDINSMWVWIPRYKYKIPSNIGSSSNVTNPPQIDVIFETGTETNGVTEAVYRNGISDDGTNTNYYTHPAFRDIDNITYNSSTSSRGAWDEEITGFWASKFVPGTTNETCNTSASVDNCLDVEPIIKPDVQSLRYQTVSTQFITALKFAGGTFNSDTGAVTFTANENNVYGLNTKSNTTDTHMMKNTEWGAVAILSQSQYGKMGNTNYTGANKEVYENNSYANSTSSYTGRSSGVPTTFGYSTYGTYSYNDITCGTDSAECTGTKVTNSGIGASTTGTIYGIYDMSGGSSEYVMGNYRRCSGFLEDNSGFNGIVVDYEDEEVDFNSGISFPELKYYDIYVSSTADILGDASLETSNWYSEVSMGMDCYAPWVERDGVFGVTANNGGGKKNISFRVVLMP